MQQRLQLAIQQAFSVGEFLCNSITRYRSQHEDHDVNERRSRGRPRIFSLLDVLDGIDDLGVSASNLQDQVTIYLTVRKFPILQFVNEPMNHFVSSEVRIAIANLADRIHSECSVPSNLHDACISCSPYVLAVESVHGEKPQLSEEMPYCTVTPNDGDGLIVKININDENPLDSAVYTRLNGIDAPELYTMQFIKTDDLQNVFCKRVGHLSLCAIHMFLRLFVYTGSAELCEELPSEDFDEPVDHYDRPLKEYWFRFPVCPSGSQEQNFITTLETMLSSRPELRRRLMSLNSITEATETEPFLLSLNALLVVTGFCHVYTKFCLDNLLLGLQALAKENNVGPLWCGASRKFTFGCVGGNQDDFILKQFRRETTSNLGRRQSTSVSNPTSFPLLPWYERKVKKSLCSNETTRLQANENMSLAAVNREPQLGMYIDIKRSNRPDSNYETVTTGEAFLQVRASRVVGVCDNDTGLGLYTLKRIPKDSYVCAYAPCAALRETRLDGDYVIEVKFHDKTVSVDGDQNTYELGLGVFCNDGTFPFSLVPGKFSRLISNRVNCEYSKWDNEVWIKSTREIAANEELLTCYSPDRSYWRSIFTPHELSKIADALAMCGPTQREAEACIKEIEF